MHLLEEPISKLNSNYFIYNTKGGRNECNFFEELLYTIIPITKNSYSL